MVYATRLDKPTSEQIDRVVEILFEAFHDDDIILGLSGYSDEAFRAELYWQIDPQNTTYETWVAVDDDEVTTAGESGSGGSASGTVRGKIVGAGLVVPPGKAYATRPQRIDDLVDPDVLEWQKTKFFHQVQALDTAAFGPEGVKPYRHLMLLGISSSCRGKGAGTVLVKRLIEEAASEGVKLSLNCEDMRVAELYKRLGFVVTADSTFALRHKDKYATGMVNECK